MSLRVYGYNDDGKEYTIYNGFTRKPVSFAWKAGKRYVYTLIFSDIPDGPNAIFKAIDYTIMIEDFIDHTFEDNSDEIMMP